MMRIRAAVRVIVAGAGLGGLLMFAVPAQAAPAGVTFTGASPLGLPLGCASEPSQAAAALSTRDTLRVTNMTGHAATLYVNGAKATVNARIPSGRGAPILFPAGTWTVALIPDCVLSHDHVGTVTVRVTTPHATPPHRPAAPKAAPAPAARAVRTTPSPTAAPPSSTPPPVTTVTTPPVSAARPVATRVRVDPSPSVTGGIAIGTAADVSAPGPATPNYPLVVLTAFGIVGVGAAAIRALRARHAAHRV